MRSLDPVHGPLGAEVLPFIEQHRIDFGRGEIPEPWRVQHR
jgi:hypothetical protein